MGSDFTDFLTWIKVYSEFSSKIRQALKFWLNLQPHITIFDFYLWYVQWNLKTQKNGIVKIKIVTI